MVLGIKNGIDQGEEGDDRVAGIFDVEMPRVEVEVVVTERICSRVCDGEEQVDKDENSEEDTCGVLGSQSHTLSLTTHHDTHRMPVCARLLWCVMREALRQRSGDGLLDSIVGLWDYSRQAQ